MAKASTQHKLDRVRPPRVQVTYDVEIGDAIEMKELPFVMGVLGDFTGQPTEPLPQLRERKFTEVNPDNFDAVLAGMKPHLAFSVQDKLTNNPDGKINVDLHFKSMEDFEPQRVAEQVPPLKKLLELRTKLSDLRGSLQGNDALEKALLDTVGSEDKLKKLRGELGGKPEEGNG
jgi:type VI secretion system protein ImpB